MDGESEAVVNLLSSQREDTSLERVGVPRGSCRPLPFGLVWAKRHDLDLAVIFVALSNHIKLQNHQQKSELQ